MKTKRVLRYFAMLGAMIILLGLNTGCKKEKQINPLLYMGKTVSLVFTVTFDKPVDWKKYTINFNFNVYLYRSVGEEGHPERTICINFLESKKSIKIQTPDSIVYRALTVLRDEEAYRVIGCHYKVGCVGYLVYFKDPMINWKLGFNPAAIPPETYKEIKDGETHITVHAILPKGI